MKERLISMVTKGRPGIVEAQWSPGVGEGCPERLLGQLSHELSFVDCGDIFQWKLGLDIHGQKSIRSRKMLLKEYHKQRHRGIKWHDTVNVRSVLFVEDKMWDRHVG